MSFDHVASRTIPSAGRPWLAWNLATASRVETPKTASFW